MLNYLLLTISVILLITGTFKYRNFAKKYIITMTLVFGFFTCYSLGYLVADYFTGKGIDNSVFYHLRYGLSGAGYGEYWPLIITICMVLIYSLLIPYKLIDRFGDTTRQNTNKSRLVLIGLILLAFTLNPTSYNLFGYYLYESLALKVMQQHDFKAYYRSPSLNQVGPNRNLVYIYAESLERTYFNESVFPGLIKELHHLESMGTSFTNIHQVSGTSWTVAGLTATQCGIPLVTSSHPNSMSGMDLFLPNATCLGDLLKKEGYNLSYYSGSSLEFAGTGKLLATHGFNDVKGKASLSKLLKDRSYQNGWGLYDNSLLDIAFSKFKHLSTNPKPFALFLSTMDTHHPDGHTSAPCRGKEYGDGGNPILNAVSCSDHLITNFVYKVLGSEFASNTTVVISSDHLAMRNSATNLLNNLDRRNFFLILNADKKALKIPRKGTLMDVAPTVLPYLGYQGEIGLGRNLLGKEDSLMSNIYDLDLTLTSWKTPLLDFWNFPKIDMSANLTIDPTDRNLELNGRMFTYPLLVEFLSNNDTLIKFEFDGQGLSNSLEYHVNNLEEGKPFLWIDSCIAMQTATIRYWEDFCVMYGKAETGASVLSGISDVKNISVSDIFNTPKKAESLRDAHRQNNSKYDIERFIAHAGGQIDGNTYTNSLEALNLSYKKGFRFFELDIIKTSDNVFVAAHDWKYWQRVTGFEGSLPPTLDTFNQHKLREKYSPLDINRINEWFSKHSDALLITDKVNTPLEFSQAFIDKNRLIMELFSLDAVKEGIQANIKSAMPTWDILSDIKENKVATLVNMGVTHIAASRRLIKSNRPLIDTLKDNGIKVYVFHVNFDEGKDENYVVCNEMIFIYGLYADKFEFDKVIDCGTPNPKFSKWL